MLQVSAILSFNVHVSAGTVSGGRGQSDRMRLAVQADFTLLKASFLSIFPDPSVACSPRAPSWALPFRPDWLETCLAIDHF